MPIIKCPQCQSSLRVQEDQGEFACPKCRRLLRIKPRQGNAAPPPEPLRGWHMRNMDGVEYGPFTDAEVLAYASESRITRDSKLKHLKHTKGEWISAVEIPAIASRLQAEPPPPPMPVQSPPIAKEPQTFEVPVPMKRSKPKESRSAAVMVSAITFGLIAGVSLAFVGVLLSQYWPVFGGLLDKALAKPWSPARVSLIPIHVFAFSLSGVALGAALGAGFAIVLNETNREQN